GRPGPGLVSHMLVGKYCDHLPLERQSKIYAREGVDLHRSTLSVNHGDIRGHLPAQIGATLGMSVALWRVCSPHS
ncbi:transposase, partial [Pseudoruegeria sp. SK021]|uniref:IS66 family transposase n=1 Tax=Pseudoruegeria sp. SK021 TaxID=1933035 RepID=UPI00352F486F